MRLPSLPICIDEFPATRSSEWRLTAATELFFLSHFHADHMKGLSSAWSAGVILTSLITKQLLLSKYDGLRGRVLGLPLWCRTPILFANTSSTSTSSSCSMQEPNASPEAVVYVTLLPAFHIPGSAMIYLETPSGTTYLHTGDFKFAAAAVQSPLRGFLQTHRVDHLYLDDTWLHLGQTELTPWALHNTDGSRPINRSATTTIRSGHDSGVRVLSKLLNAAQVAEAMEAIGRRMDHQRSIFQQWQRTNTGKNDSNTTTVNGASARQPFVVRVYLHNQFGKELLIQQLAERLRTRAIVDDVRYARLLTVVEALEEEQDDLNIYRTAEHNPDVAPQAVALSTEEKAWRLSGGEAAQYPYDLNYFMSTTQAQTLFMSADHHSNQNCFHDSPASPIKCAGDGRNTACVEMPLIEVVSTRDAISPAALQAACEARQHTPHYGVVISGWARLQTQTRGPGASGQVWHIPTTLHCTPQEIIDFVALLRPLSVTPLHYRPSRGAIVMQRLGPYLRTPFVNHHDTGVEDVAGVVGDVHPRSSTGSSYAVRARRWAPCIPPHVVWQDGVVVDRDGEGIDSAILGSRSGGGGNGCPAAAAGVCFAAVGCSECSADGLDSLVEKRLPGYRIQPPSALHATAPVHERPWKEARSDGDENDGDDDSTSASEADVSNETFSLDSSPCRSTPVSSTLLCTSNVGSLQDGNAGVLPGSVPAPADTTVTSERVAACSLPVLHTITQANLNKRSVSRKRERVAEVASCELQKAGSGFATLSDLADDLL